MNLPKRELLLLRVVLALPNTSNMGLAAKIVGKMKSDLSDWDYDLKF